MLTVARAALLLSHVPPLTDGVMVILLPTQTTDAPDSVPATGNGLTDSILVATSVPQLLLTV